MLPDRQHQVNSLAWLYVPTGEAAHIQYHNLEQMQLYSGSVDLQRAVLSSLLATDRVHGDAHQDWLSGVPITHISDLKKHSGGIPATQTCTSVMATQAHKMDFAAI